MASKSSPGTDRRWKVRGDTRSAWVGGGTFSSNPEKKRGRQSFGYHDGRDEVHETNIFHDGFEFTVIERIRRDEAAGTVLFVIEVTGPDATTARHEHRYSLP